jgi:glutamyl-tRNA synthetase
MSKVRVRFAPSPTGPLHIGGVRTALYNYIFAKKHGGDFLLRIEDTDQTRYVPGAEQYIIDALKWIGIETDEGPVKGGNFGPYRQSERKEVYREYAERLISEGYAYYAFDTPEELNQMRENQKAQGIPNPQYNSITRQYMKNAISLPADEVEKRLAAGDPYVIRIKMPRDEEVKLNDIIRGWVVVNTAQLDDKVLFKGDGMPTYHLANVVDDHLMEISHVIRGEEWLPSAPLHVLLHKYLGWEEQMPQFAHLPLLLKPNGNGKLSKRDGDALGFPVFPLEWTNPETGEVSSGYKESGYLSEAFINILSFLGWHPSDHKELFSLEELIEAFTLERVSKSGAKFDVDKAKWFQQQYLMQTADATLATMLKPLLEDKGIDVSDEYIATVCGATKERATFVNDLWEVGTYFYLAPDAYDPKTIKKKWKEDSATVLSAFIDTTDALTAYNSVTTHQVFQDTLKQFEKGVGAVMPIIRVALTGVMQGPPVFEIMEILGKEESTLRMKNAIEKFDELKQEQSVPA